MAAILPAAFGGSADRARADGDPASDVLASYSLFMPADGGVAPAQQAQLRGLLTECQRRSFPLRMAVIAAPFDLGSVGQLWLDPGAYARFLGVELSLVFRGTLLVVMPNGFGVYRPGAAVGPQLAALAGVRRAGLGPTALAAVQRLAAAAGHPLVLPRASVIAPPGSVDVTAWIAFALGLGMVTLPGARACGSSRRSARCGGAGPSIQAGSTQTSKAV